MSTAAIPFNDLAQRIAEQEAELAKLREELMSRRATLTDLTRRKEELETELEQVEAEIEAVGHVTLSGSPASTAAKPSSVKPKPAAPQAAKPSAAKSVTKPAASGKAGGKRQKQTLHDALTEVLAASSRPLSAAELAEQLVANGYKSRSKDLKNVIWVGIGKMPDIERIPNQGYRLKKRKSAESGKKN